MLLKIFFLSTLQEPAAYVQVLQKLLQFSLRSLCIHKIRKNKKPHILYSIIVILFVCFSFFTCSETSLTLQAHYGGPECSVLGGGEHQMFTEHLQYCALWLLDAGPMYFKAAHNHESHGLQWEQTSLYIHYWKGSKCTRQQLNSPSPDIISISEPKEAVHSHYLQWQHLLILPVGGGGLVLQCPC